MSKQYFMNTMCSRCRREYQIENYHDKCPHCSESDQDRKLFKITIILLTIVATAYVILLKVTT